MTSFRRCQIEQAHSLQRHAQRFPTSSFDDGLNDENFAAKVLNFTKANPNAKFTGPLAFLNTYEYQMGESYVRLGLLHIVLDPRVSTWYKRVS